jgi:hypothetical protein
VLLAGSELTSEHPTSGVDVVIATVELIIEVG